MLAIGFKRCTFVMRRAHNYRAPVISRTCMSKPPTTFVDRSVSKSAPNKHHDHHHDHDHDHDHDHGDHSSLVDDEDEMEDMFVEGPAGIEWGGPTRGGTFPEPTRYGDWERKGRTTDF